ncbi:MAG: nitrous oxide reductase accessory protein NosL [Myxococcota bacterium]
MKLWQILTPVGLAAALGFGWMLHRAQALPQGPVPIVWDQEACAHCRMHVGEPGFAAQAQLEDGTILNFDDPGCLLSWSGEPHPKVHAIYLHHHREDRWLVPEAAGFVPAQPTPMGFGLAVVDKTSSTAIGWDEAQKQVRRRRGGS